MTKCDGEDDQKKKLKTGVKYLNLTDNYLL